MNSRNLILIVALLGAASCSPKSDDSAIPAASDATPASGTAVAIDGPPLQVGVYTVCTEDGIEGASGAHSGFDPDTELTGVHLRKGDVLEFSKIDLVTSMTLKPKRIPGDPASEARPDEVWKLLGDKTKLRTLREFKHELAGTPVEVSHLIEIIKVPTGSVPGCNKPNLLRINFCGEFGRSDGSTFWDCEDPNAPDRGHAHAEN